VRTTKYFLALASRSVRRVAAKVHAADLDTDVRSGLMRELTQMLTWQRDAALIGWPHNDHVTHNVGEDSSFEIDLAVYSDGRPVFSVIDGSDGYATLVHRPDSLQDQTDDTGELAEEMCPCCGGMPETASGPGDDGGFDAPNMK
jgi:hypothetical protein